MSKGVVTLRAYPALAIASVGGIDLPALLSGNLFDCLLLNLSWLIISPMNYRDFITVEPNKRGGKPCVRGLRITVYEVLEYLASDMTEEEILDDFPDLTRQDLKACIAFAADRDWELLQTGQRPQAIDPLR